MKNFLLKASKILCGVGLFLVSAAGSVCDKESDVQLPPLSTSFKNTALSTAENDRTAVNSVMLNSNDNRKAPTSNLNDNGSRNVGNDRSDLHIDDPNLDTKNDDGTNDPNSGIKND